MNIAEPFIKRPVATTLLVTSILIFGIMGYRLLPVSDLPTIDYPTIQVNANLPGASPETLPDLDHLVGHAIAYYRDFVRPAKRYRDPTPVERAALADLAAVLRALPPDASAEAIQDELYAVGKRHPFPDLKSWFACLYQVLLGQAEGPRFGGFVALYGIPETTALIDAALRRAASAA